MLLKNLILTICLFVITSTPASSFQMSSDELNPEKPRKSLTIHESNFSCFQSLQCLIRENPFPKSNLDEVRLNNNSEKFVVEGTSKNETMHAVYNGSGDLIKATVIQRNIALPKTILRVLTSSEFDDWSLIGNELVIENFDKDSMQYKVILKNGDEVRVEYFDKYGQFQNRFL